MLRRKAVLALMIGFVSVIGLFASDKDCACTPKTKTQDCGCAPETKTPDCRCAPETKTPDCACAPEKQAPDCCAPQVQRQKPYGRPGELETAQQNTTPPEAETIAGTQQ